MAKPKKISQRILAKHWGCSQPHVFKCIEKGCPTDSLEAADAWRALNSPRGLGYRSKAKTKVISAKEVFEPKRAANAPELAVDAPIAEGAPGERLNTLRASLEASIDVETEAHRMVKSAMERSVDAPLAAATLPPLIAAYNKAKDGRMASEKLIKALEREAQITITMDQAREICARAWMPLVMTLRGAPKRAGMKANPMDDVLAESVFRAEIEDALTQAQKVFAFPDVV